MQRTQTEPGSSPALSRVPSALVGACLSALAGLSACVTGGGGGGGGGLLVGGPQGASCSPATTAEGCFQNQRVRCDATSSQWLTIEVCPANKACVLSAGSAPGTFVSTCAVVASTGPLGDAGGGSATDDSVSTSNNDAGGGGSGDAGSGSDAVKEVSVIGQPSCGNGTCDEGETPANCAKDCSLAVCGNSKCEAGETPSLCPKDCGSPVVCGNGTCEPGESKANCPQDCGTTAVCGNGTCESGETASNCPKDCGTAACCASKGAQCGTVSGCTGSCGSCASGKVCTANQCVVDSGGGSCIEQYCQADWDACVNDGLCIGIIGYLVVNACAKDNNCQDSACTQKYCADEVSQCQQTPGCVTFITCLQDCTTDACASACVDEANGYLYTALVDCAQTNCP